MNKLCYVDYLKDILNNSEITEKLGNTQTFYSDLLSDLETIINQRPTKDVRWDRLKDGNYEVFRVEDGELYLNKKYEPYFLFLQVFFVTSYKYNNQEYKVLISRDGNIRLADSQDNILFSLTLNKIPSSIEFYYKIENSKYLFINFPNQDYGVFTLAIDKENKKIEVVGESDIYNKDPSILKFYKTFLIYTDESDPDKLYMWNQYYYYYSSAKYYLIEVDIPSMSVTRYKEVSQISYQHTLLDKISDTEFYGLYRTYFTSSTVVSVINKIKFNRDTDNFPVYEYDSGIYFKKTIGNVSHIYMNSEENKIYLSNFVDREPASLNIVDYQGNFIDKIEFKSSVLTSYILEDEDFNPADYTYTFTQPVVTNIDDNYVYISDTAGNVNYLLIWQIDKIFLNKDTLVLLEYEKVLDLDYPTFNKELIYSADEDYDFITKTKLITFEDLLKKNYKKDVFELYRLIT